MKTDVNVNALVRLGVVLVCALGFAGCDETTGPDRRELRVVTGGGQRDTVDALLRQALVIEVNSPDGEPLAGATVRLRSRTAPGGDAFGPATLTVATYTGPFGRLVSNVTDQSGRVAFLVRLGAIAGPTLLDIEVLKTTLRDSVAFTIVPGGRVRIQMAPRDSAVYAGRTYRTRAATVDRHGNVRDDSVELSVLGSSLTMDQGMVRGVALGRGRVIARHGSLADTGWVTVTPEGMLGAWKAPRVVAFALDGSGYREYSGEGYSGLEEGAPVWSPGKAELLHLAGDSYGWPLRTWLMVTNVETAANRNLFPDGRRGSLGRAQYARDGSWVYYSRNECNLAMTLWRVRADGTGEERVGPARECFNSAKDPTPSPDGSRLAFVFTDARLHVLDIASNSYSALEPNAARPRWSPVDDRIAFTANETVSLVNADGTGHRNLTPRGRRYADGVDWSPDGSWIAAYATDSARIEIIDVSSGAILPLGYTTGLMHPAWQR